MEEEEEKEKHTLAPFLNSGSRSHLVRFAGVSSFFFFFGRFRGFEVFFPFLLRRQKTNIIMTAAAAVHLPNGLDGLRDQLGTSSRLCPLFPPKTFQTFAQRALQFHTNTSHLFPPFSSHHGNARVLVPVHVQ